MRGRYVQCLAVPTAPGVLAALLQPWQMEAPLHVARSSSSFAHEELRPASGRAGSLLVFSFSRTITGEVKS